jgi:hypothetical protein
MMRIIKAKKKKKTRNIEIHIVNHKLVLPKHI